ncbi:MAG: WD40 repeat domain-containing protein [Sphingobacteriales bacterium]|nr:MAG: WD40 repeat domain-containing protein [Sphingobacteriales bacterium]
MQKVDVEKLADLTGHRDAIYVLIHAENEGEFFSAGGDGHVVLWNANTPDSPGKVVARFSSVIYSLIYLKDENSLLVGTRFGSLYLLNLNNNKQEKYLELAGDIFALHLYNDTLFAACADGHIYSIDLKHFSIKQHMQPTQANARSLAFNNETNTLACGFSDGFIRLYNAKNLEEKVSYFAHEKSVFALQYLPDGNLLSGGRDAQIRIWKNNISGLAERTIPAHLFTINKLIYSPSKKYFVSASRDKSFKIWNTELLDLLKVIERPKFAAHSHSVNTALWINENTIISAGDDKTIKIWKLNFFEKQD